MLVSTLTAALAVTGALLGDMGSVADSRGLLGRKPSPCPAQVGFVENRGQWTTPVSFVGRGAGMQVLAEPGAIGLVLPGASKEEGVYVRLVFEGGREQALIEPQERLPGARHYFLGDDASRWRTDVPAYARLVYRGLYPGIDVVLRFEGSALEYDVLLAPGAALDQFVVRCEGIEELEGESDHHVLSTALGQLSHCAGRTWQVRPSGGEIDRSCGLVRLDDRRFGLEVAGRNAALPTIIDPSLTWSTYLGGVDTVAAGDFAWGVALDPANGDVLVVGHMDGTGFPQTPGTWQDGGLLENAFVTRLRAADGALVYSSVFGGRHHERAYAVGVDASGRPTIVGESRSRDFPTTSGAFDTIKTSFSYSGFVLRLSSMGHALEYSTLLEGAHTPQSTIPWAIEVRADGAAIIAGMTGSFDLPFPSGGADTTLQSQEGFVMQLNSSGASVDWGTFLGGSEYDEVFALRLGNDGLVTVGGTTTSTDFPTTPGTWQSTWIGSPYATQGFVTRLTGDGSAILWSTLFGGAGFDHGEDIFALDVMPSGDVVVGGWTSSSDNFPVTPGAFQTVHHGGGYDGFLARFDSTASSLVMSTLAGTQSSYDRIIDLAVDPSGVVSFLGQLGGTFPTTPGSWSPVSSPNLDLLVGRLHPSGARLLYSTYLGGPNIDYGFDLALAPGGRVTVSGASFYGGFPTTPGSAQPGYAGGQTDATVTTFDLLLEGVELHGASTPSCNGPLQLNTTRMPLAGDSSFGLWCSAAPPSSPGWLVLGSPATTPLPIFGANVWVDLSQRFARRTIRSDADGFVEIPLGPPPGPTGTEFTAQCVFLGTPTCVGPARLSASNALRIRIQ